MIHRGARGARALTSYLACIRYRDVLVLQGSPLLGVAFAMGDLSPAAAIRILVFGLASFLLVAHIFSFNDWAGVPADARDPNKSATVALTRGISRPQLAGLSLGLLVLSLLLFAVLPRPTLLIAITIAALSLLYSHPVTNAKGIPVVSSLPHLLGGVLHFLLGYSVAASVDRRGILIALFFALTFTAGHLNQEVRDHDGDRGNGVRTNAVAFGKTPTFAAGLLVFTVAYADLLLLAHSGIVPRALGLLPLLLYPIHVFWFVRALRGGLTFESVSRFQRRYRMIYALMGLGMVATLLCR